MHHMKEYHQFLFLYSKSFLKSTQNIRLIVTVQTGCSQVPGPAANIIFIEKRISLAPHKQIFAHLMDTALHEELHRS